MPLLNISAGPTAYQHLCDHGLKPEHISTIIGASGAAKWLSIYGLDRIIYSDWLADIQHDIRLFGTSIGAFKLAVACLKDPAKGFDAFANAYIEQSYENGLTPEDVEREAVAILQHATTPAHVEEILSHPHLRYSCGTVRCKKGFASDDVGQQKRAMATLGLLNFRGRMAYRSLMERVIFHDPRLPYTSQPNDGFPTQHVPLSINNCADAIMASGSLPVYMHPVKNISGAPTGVYRDGGMLDYHPIPDSFGSDDGLVLYPHFFNHCSVGWFDKYLSWRKASAKQLDNVILISPSDEFLALTELKRIPDRSDFATYKGNDAERMRLWREFADKSHLLGQEFIKWVNCSDLASHVNRLTQ